MSVFMQWVDNTVSHLDNYNENGSGSVVLFVEILSVNICKFKKDFILRRGHRVEGSFKIYSRFRRMQGRSTNLFRNRPKMFHVRFPHVRFPHIGFPTSTK